MPPSPPAARALARQACVGGCLALILFYSLTSLLLAPSPNPLRWLVQVLPLALFLPGLLKSRPRVYQWLCFLILLYFINGVLRAFMPGGLAGGLVEILLCLLVFASAIVFVHGHGTYTRT